MEQVSIDLQQPITAMPLPQAEFGDAQNILVKAEGNSLRVTIVWNLVNEETTVVTSDGATINSSKYAGGTITNADEMMQFLTDEFQSKGVEYKYQLIIPSNTNDSVTQTFSRFGSIEKLSITKSGRTPVTWRASLSFVAGDLVTVET